MWCPTCNSGDCRCGKRETEWFWMVWVENSTSPTVQHRSAQAAKDEARRLATQVPGRRVYVLKANLFVRAGGFEEKQLDHFPPTGSPPEF